MQARPYTEPDPSRSITTSQVSHHVQRVTSLRRRARANAHAAMYWLSRPARVVRSLRMSVTTAAASRHVAHSVVERRQGPRLGPGGGAAIRYEVFPVHG